MERVGRSRFAGLGRPAWLLVRPVLFSWRAATPALLGAGVAIAFIAFDRLLVAIVVGLIGVLAWGFVSLVGAGRANRTLIAKGLQRIGVRHVPGFRRFEDRSPRVGHALMRAWEGHVDLSLALLASIADDEKGSLGERLDASLAIADWHLAHGRPNLAAPWLARHHPTRTKRDLTVLRLEATSLGVSDLPNVSNRMRRRLSRDADLGFFLANEHRGERRLEHVNRLLRATEVTPIRCTDGQLCFDALRCDIPRRASGTRVTVIVPMFNAATTIEMSVRSLLAQTWSDLEILVVDDASTDGSAELVEQLGHPRVRVIRQTTNAGTYAARNRALAESTGEFVTVHDADDWCHPERIERQVAHLLAHPDLMGTTSTLVRATADMVFVRRDLTHSQVLGVNTASLMVRTDMARAAGGWDDVRVGADSEFVDRLRALHGEKSIEQILPSTPLTVALRSDTTLTSSSTTGLASHLVATGARHLYHEAYTHWHGQRASLDRTDDKTPFFAPRLLRTRTSETHLDVVIVSDFSLPGGTTASNLTEVAANEALGLTTGLVHNRNPTPRPQLLNTKIFDALSTHTTLLSDGELVSCDVLVVKYPPSVMEIPDRFPSIDVRGDVVIAVNQTPFANYTGPCDLVYDIATCNAEVIRRFGKRPIWSPIGPAVRDALLTHHAAEVADIELSPDDWVEIIDVAAWQRPRQSNSIPRIGRHGRDSEWKWPSNPATLRTIFPETTDFVVDILGGADTARRLLRGLPSNWVVRPFDAIEPADYLAQLDVFVYFPHPAMVEGFGRTILEAMAAGVPCVVDSRFSELFADGVVACTPDVASAEIRRILQNGEHREQLIQRAQRVVDARFGMPAHRERLRVHS